MLRILFQRTLGAVAILMGLTVTAWFVYNQIWPTDEFEGGFSSVIQLILSIAFIAVGWRWLRYDGKGIEEVSPPDLQCSELEASIVKARSTLPDFLREVEKGIDGAFVKFPIHVPGGVTENIWAYVHFFRDGEFNVSLANEPVNRDIEAEGRRTVSSDEVLDWQIMQPDGMIRGAYSLIALFEYRKRLGKAVSPKMKKQKALLLDAA